MLICYQIVDQESGVLGYPREGSAPMAADHLNVCKFKDMEDANYISLTNTLRDWVGKLEPRGKHY